MEAVPRKRPPFLQRERTRHGRMVWYFRRDKEPRIRLPDEYGSEEFWAAYEAAAAGRAATSSKRTPAKPNTLRWLIDNYRLSSDFQKLAPATKRVRERLFERVCEKSGETSVSRIDRTAIVAGRERRAATPEAANAFLKAMRVLFNYGIEAGLIEGTNPASAVRKLAPKTEGGFRMWTLDEVQLFERRHPIGTKARLALDILLYTGLRRSDAVVLGRQHIRSGVLTIRTQKTGEIVTLRVLDPLRRSIEATKTGDLTMLVTEYGKPFSVAGWGNWFRDRCAEAGVHGSAHGLRKAAATRAAEAGATTMELMAMFGWQSVKEAERYTRAASRAALGVRASGKLGKQTRNKKPAP